MNLERVEAILKLLQRQSHVGTLAVEGEGWRLHARRGELVPAMPAAEPAPEEAASEEIVRHVVPAQAVGIYRAPKAVVSLGDFIGEGAALGSIDSMRILNPVTTEHSGYLAEVLVEDGDPVEYGQQLFVLSAEPLTHEASH